MITIVFRIIYEQEQLENFLVCKLLQAKPADFFLKLVLVPLICCLHSNFQNTQNKIFKDYKLQFKGRSPKFKDFSTTNSFSRKTQISRSFK